jgi:hypothetical protein
MTIKKSPFFIGFVIASLIVVSSLSSVLANSIPTLFITSIEEEDDAYAYLSDHFFIAYFKDIHDQLYAAMGDDNRRYRSDTPSAKDVPPLAIFIGNLVEDNRKKIVKDMGYLEPVGALNNKIPILLQKLPDGIHGYASIQEDGTPFMIINPFLPDEDLKLTLAHEFFHTIQFGYDHTAHALYQKLEPEEKFGISSKMAEGTAVWMENTLYPELDTYEERINESFFTIPYKSIFGSSDHVDAPNSVSRYGTFLWYRFLSDTFGDEVIIDLWEEYFRLSRHEGEENIPFAVRSYNAHVNTLTNTQDNALLSEVFADFVLQNLVEPGKYGIDVSKIQLTFTQEISHYPYSSDETVIRDLPELFGTNYIRLDTHEQSGNLVVQLNGESPAVFTVSMIPYRDGKYLVDDMKSRVVDSGKTASLGLVLDNYEFVTLAVSVTGLENIEDLGHEDPFSGKGYEYEYTVKNTQLRDLAGAGIIPEPEPIETKKPISPSRVTQKRLSLKKIPRKIFNDVSSRHEFSEAIEFLRDSEIVDGYGDGTYQPERRMNRAEFTKIIMEAYLGEDGLDGGGCFPDTEVGAWFSPYICTAKRLGVVNGMPNGKFMPNDDISIAAAYKIILETFIGADVIPDVDGAWFDKYFEYAAANGMKHRDEFTPWNTITRGEMAQLIFLVQRVTSASQ